MDEPSTTYRIGDALITRVTEQQFQLKTDKLFAHFDSGRHSGSPRMAR